MSLGKAKIIVTGGPTREWFDPIRFLSNASTGKMGVALADVAHGYGGEVVFIHGPIADKLIEGKQYRSIAIESTEDMLNAISSELEEGAILIMAAAPADYTPLVRSDFKIKKEEGELSLVLKRTPDILKTISNASGEKFNDRLFLVGFAAETNNTEEYARGKLASKGLDMICLNDVSQEGSGFGCDSNIMTIFFRDGSRLELSKQSKGQIAERIFLEIESKYIEKFKNKD